MDIALIPEQYLDTIILLLLYVVHLANIMFGELLYDVNWQAFT